MRYQVPFIQMRGRGCRWHSSDIEWALTSYVGFGSPG